MEPNQIPIEEQRFWYYVQQDAPDACWLWEGARRGNDKGYGVLRFKGRMEYAHRVAWLLTYGPIPTDKMILHTCDTRPCVNPRHLYAGTHAENMRDRHNRNRTCVGRQHPLARFTETQVLEIRRRFNEGQSADSLAREFGMSKSVTWAAATEKTWKWLKSA